MSPSYTPQLHAILSALIEERTGILFGPSEKEILASKITAHAEEHGFGSLLDFYYYLRYDDRDLEAMRALTDALIVTETYFFRELDQLELIAHDIIPLLLDAGMRPRVLIAGAATGEEPLSLSMLLEARGLLDQVRIVATDLSPTMLDRAQSGRFRRRSLRSPPPHDAEQFLRIESGEVFVDPKVARSIEWREMNLVNDTSMEKLGFFHLILCRNVMIYFRDSTIREVVDRLSALLEPSGMLFVGVSESLLRLGTSLVCEEKKGVFFYRKSR